MFGTHFYHQKTRKAVSLFGALFNKLYVIRKNSAGAVISQVKVPLSYAPKSKYLERIRENPDLTTNTQVAVKLPRMSFEITSIAYDVTRQLTKTSNFNTISTSGNSKRQQFKTPVPYNINFQLNIYARNQDDALQLVEQILPTFNPQYTITIKPFASEYSSFLEDIPVIIQGVSFQDDFEGAQEQRRTIIYSLEFEMKLSYYGPIADKSIVRKSIASVFDMKAGHISDSDVQVERITVTPNPLASFGTADSDFGFTTAIKLISDSST